MKHTSGGDSRGKGAPLPVTASRRSALCATLCLFVFQAQSLCVSCALFGSKMSSLMAWRFLTYGLGPIARRSSQSLIGPREAPHGSRMLRSKQFVCPGACCDIGPLQQFPWRCIGRVRETVSREPLEHNPPFWLPFWSTEGSTTSIPAALTSVRASHSSSVPVLVATLVCCNSFLGGV
jgi:hypothetical protein